MPRSYPPDFCPYPGLAPYDAEYRDLLFGRETDQRVVESNLLAAPLTILYGFSGIGKTSLLQAKVVPSLETKTGMPVVVFRKWQHDTFWMAIKRDTWDAVSKVAPGHMRRQAEWRASRGAARTQLELVAAGTGPPDGEEEDVASERKPFAAPTLQEFPDFSLPFDEFLAQCTRLCGRVFFVLDQFEEYFVYHRSEERNGGFDAEFASAVNRRDLHVNFLLSLREEDLSKLDRLKRRIPNLMGNTLRLSRLSRDDARRVIVRPLQVYGHLPNGVEPALVDELLGLDVRFDQGGEGRLGAQGRVESAPAFETERTLLQALADRLTRGLRALRARVGHVVVEPPAPGGAPPPRPPTPTQATSSSVFRGAMPFLQIVLTRLWAEERFKGKDTAGSPTLRLETYRRLGGAQTIVREYVRAAMGELGRGDRHLAAGFFEYLVTPSGTKIAHSARNLAIWVDSKRRARHLWRARTRDSVDRLARRAEAILTRLVKDARLLRIVAPPAGAEGEPGTEPQLYELAHDSLGAAMLAWRREYQEGRTLRTYAVLALGLVGLFGSIAFYNFRVAQREVQVTNSSLLAASAIERLREAPSEGLRLAVAAIDEHPTAVAWLALDRWVASRERVVLREPGVAPEELFVGGRPGEEPILALRDERGNLWTWRVGTWGRGRLIAPDIARWRVIRATLSPDATYIAWDRLGQTRTAFQGVVVQSLDGTSAVDLRPSANARVQMPRSDSILVSQAVFSLDSRQVAAVISPMQSTWTRDVGVGIWEVGSWRHLHTLVDSTGGSDVLYGPPQFSPRDSLIAVALYRALPSRPKTRAVRESSYFRVSIGLWHTGSGKRVATLQAGVASSLSGPMALIGVQSLRFSPDGGLLAVGIHGAGRVWRTSDWASVGTFPRASQFDFVAGGRLLAAVVPLASDTVREERDILRLFNAATLADTGMFPDTTSDVTGFLAGGADSVLIVLSDAQPARLWSIGRRDVETLPVLAISREKIAVVPGSRLMAFIGHDSTVRILETENVCARYRASGPNQALLGCVRRSYRPLPLTSAERDSVLPRTATKE